MMSMNFLRGATEWSLMVALVFGAGTFAKAQEADNPDKGVVQIGRSDKADSRPNLPPPGEQADDERPAAPKYWIGLLGGAIPADNPLRAQLDLPEKTGLLVANVMPESPAAKAGLKQHDILLKANNKELHEMKDLVDLVMSEGPKKGQITLEVLRHNKRETLNLKPEERPANVQMPQGVAGAEGGSFGMGGPGFPGMPEQFMQQFGGQFPEFRNLGPGVILRGEGQGVGSMPNGVSISIQKQNDQPTHITVTRGKDKWEITGDDPESLKKLPDDLRPFVERMLHGGGIVGGGVGGVFHGSQGFQPQGPGNGPEVAGRLRDRLEQMEKRLDDMQRRLHGSDNSPADKPTDQRGQEK
jgi:hypothetical protein